MLEVIKKENQKENIHNWPSNNLHFMVKTESMEDGNEYPAITLPSNSIPRKVKVPKKQMFITDHQITSALWKRNQWKMEMNAQPSPYLSNSIPRKVKLSSTSPPHIIYPSPLEQ